MIFFNFNPVNPNNRNFSYFGSAKQLHLKNVLDKIKETLEKDNTVVSGKKAEIKDSIDEIENNLKAGKIPKFEIESLVSLAGDVSSIGSLVLSLIQFISK